MSNYYCFEIYPFSTCSRKHLKHWGKRSKQSNEQFLLLSLCFQHNKWLYFHILRISMVLSKCFQSHIFADLMYVGKFKKPLKYKKTVVNTLETILLKVCMNERYSLSYESTHDYFWSNQMNAILYILAGFITVVYQCKVLLKFHI